MSFIGFFVKRHQFTLLLFLALLILGINSLFNMPRSEDPPFGAPIFSIVAIYPGASPKDMEELVVDPVEEEVYKLGDIKKINTSISDGLMISLAEFNYGVDVDAKNNDIIREINKIRPELPEGLLELSVKRAASSDVSILQTALVSDVASYKELKESAEKLKRELERIHDIKFVEIQAVPDQEIQIELQLDKMAQLSLGLNQVLGMIEANNINIPAGDVNLGKKNYHVKVNAPIANIDELKKTVIRTNPQARPLLLEDIAMISEKPAESQHLARFNGQRAVWVVSAMKDKKNILQLRERMESILEQFKSQLPEHIKMEQAFDQEKGVRHRLAGLAKDFLIAILLVMLTLLPLGTRASWVVMISIPLSLSIGLFLLDMMGYTLNQLSIVGMVIALGLLVDDSIVVVENIERYLRSGISPKEAAITATRHIFVAVLGCTAALILAFLPLAHLPEGSGDFIRSLPMAVMLTVLASLFVSLTIIPFLASVLLKPAAAEGNHSNWFYSAFKNYLNAPYQRFLGWCMKHPVWTLISAALLFGLSFLLIPRLGFSLFPASEKPILIIDLDTEFNSNMEHTDRIARAVEHHLLNKPEVLRLATNIGKGNPRIYYNEFQSQRDDQLAQMMVFLDDRTEVPEIVRFAEQLRKELREVAGAEIKVRRFEQGPPISAPIEMRIIGKNLDSLEYYATEVEKIMRSVNGCIYIRNDLKYKKSDLSLKINKYKAGLYAVPTGEIARTIRLAIEGLEWTSIQDENDEELELRISTSKRNSNPLKQLEQIHISSLSGALVPLKSLVDIEMEPSASAIQHYNKERYSSVQAFTAQGYNTDQLTDEIIQKIGEKLPLSEGYSLLAAGERMSREESFGGMGTIVLLAVFGLLAILILEFRTLKSTLIVLSVIPMGVIGALVALYLGGESLSFVATIGMIALAGIEIKNSILMVDYTNQLREKGIGLYEAVMDGAETRFLPIFLTSLTAIGGMIPLLLERSPLISPLALVLIGGLVSSTLLSRLVTPVLYYLIPPKVN